jgi:regulatory protein
MDSAEHGEGSSSQNDKKLVTSVTKRGAGRGQVKVTLSDGSSFLIFQEIQEEEGITAGEEYAADWLKAREEDSEKRRAESRALSLLGYGPHSRQGLRQKLRQRGFSEESADHALARMEELGYLDDAKFAEAWIQSRLKKHPEGRWALFAGLMKKGIDRETAEQALAASEADMSEEEAARKAMEKLSRNRAVPRITMASRLASRGFSLPIINRVLTDYPIEGRRDREE